MMIGASMSDVSWTLVQICWLYGVKNFTVCHWCCFSCSQRSAGIFCTVAWTFGT